VISSPQFNISLAHRFFLGIAILQFFPKFSTISPGAAILPLIVVLTVSAVKDGYEDFKRHQSDSQVNNSKLRVLSGDGWSNPNVTSAKSRSFFRSIIPTSVLPGSRKEPTADSSPLSAPEYDYNGVDEQGNEGPHWKQVSWEDLRVGDFVKIMDNEPIPADILICSTSEEENVAFVETKNLDGETNLKSRRAVSALTELRNAKQCADSQYAFRIQCERPDTDMYRLNANVIVQGSTSSVDLSTTLLRGTVLRNTGWVIGVVLFTGLDTKIVMNSGGTPSKRSKVERQMNPQVSVVTLFMKAAMLNFT